MVGTQVYGFAGVIFFPHQRQKIDVICFGSYGFVQLCMECIADFIGIAESGRSHIHRTGRQDRRCRHRGCLRPGVQGIYRLRHGIGYIIIHIRHAFQTASVNGKQPYCQLTVPAQENTVVFTLTEHGFRYALDPHKRIAGRELVGEIFIDFGGKAAVHQTIPGKLREGGQAAVFLFGEFHVRRDHKGNGKGKYNHGKQDGGGDIDDFAEFHMYNLLLRK